LELAGFGATRTLIVGSSYLKAGMYFRVDGHAQAGCRTLMRQRLHTASDKKSPTISVRVAPKARKVPILRVE